MSYSVKVALVFALAASTAPNAAHAYPAAESGKGEASSPIVKVQCCYDSCWDNCCWSDCWRPRYYGYWRRDYDWDREYYHSRYYSHYRWGSYHRYWRSWEYPGWAY